MNKNRSGILALFLAYLIWGAMPVYWKALEFLSSSEILGHRVIWSAIFTSILILLQKNWISAVDLISNRKKDVLLLAAGGFLIAFNWGLYIWAINHGRILEASLGYFINPLVSMFFGMIFFHEKLRKVQLVALALAVTGVAAELIAVGSIPIVSIGLALSFGLYGVLKKAISVSPSVSLFIETVTICPLAMVWLFLLQETGVASYPYDFTTNLLLAGTGIITSIPLILFAYGASRVPMTTMGFVQYVSPTLSFILGTFVYNEPLLISRICTFLFIWTALVLYSADAIIFSRRMKV